MDVVLFFKAALMGIVEGLTDFKLNAADQKVANKEGHGNTEVKCCSFGSFREPIAIGKQIITFVVEAAENALRYKHSVHRTDDPRG